MTQQLTRTDLLRQIIPNNYETALAMEWRRLPETISNPRLPELGDRFKTGNFTPQTEERAAAIMDFLSGRPRTASEIAQNLDIHRASISNILGCLRRRGMVSAKYNHATGAYIWEIAEDE